MIVSQKFLALRVALVLQEILNSFVVLAELKFSNIWVWSHLSSRMAIFYGAKFPSSLTAILQSFIVLQWLVCNFVMFMFCG